MKTITDKQAEDLLLMFDCIEIWGINSKGIQRLWEENKALIEEVTERLYGPVDDICQKHMNQKIWTGRRYECLECAEVAMKGLAGEDKPLPKEAPMVSGKVKISGTYTEDDLKTMGIDPLYVAPCEKAPMVQKVWPCEHVGLMPVYKNKPESWVFRYTEADWSVVHESWNKCPVCEAVRPPRPEPEKKALWEILRASVADYIEDWCHKDGNWVYQIPEEKWQKVLKRLQELESK